MQHSNMKNKSYQTQQATLNPSSLARTEWRKLSGWLIPEL